MLFFHSYQWFCFAIKIKAKWPKINEISMNVLKSYISVYVAKMFLFILPFYI